MNDQNSSSNEVQKESTPNREITRNPETYITPLVDIYETNEALSVVADMPGVSRDDLNVRIDKGVLTIEGKMRPREFKDCNWHLREYRSLNFFRQFEIPDSINREKIGADFKHGVLTLTLPKGESEKPRQIPINIG